MSQFKSTDRMKLMNLIALNIKYGKCEIDDQTKSQFNTENVTAVMDLLEHLIDDNALDIHAITIMTPYSTQLCLYIKAIICLSASKKKNLHHKIMIAAATPRKRKVSDTSSIPTATPGPLYATPSLKASDRRYFPLPENYQCSAGT